ncbi:MAG: PEPxxWA-CTERM sorting domain-containing protein [Polymorphobacter sp.]
MFKLRTIATAAALAAVAVPAQAVITVGTLTGGNQFTRGGTFVLIPGGTVALNAFNTDNIYGLNEKQNVVLASDLVVQIGDSPILAGTGVNSHLIFADPAAAGTNIASGSITFRTKIRGVILLRSNLLASNATFNNGLTTYGTMQGTEASDILSFNGNVLNYSFFNSAATTDMIRVLTAVPEPQTWAMLVAGFGLIGVAARRRKSAITA